MKVFDIESREVTAYALIFVMLMILAVAIFFVRRNSWQAVASRGRKAELKRYQKQVEQPAVLQTSDVRACVAEALPSALCNQLADKAAASSGSACARSKNELRGIF